MACKEIAVSASGYYHTIDHTTHAGIEQVKSDFFIVIQRNDPHVSVMKWLATKQCCS